MKRCVAIFNDGWADWEAAPVLAALREHLTDWELAVATPRGEHAQSIAGVWARADLSFAEVKPDALDLLVVIGSDQWAAREHPEVYSLIARTVEAQKPVGAICAATIAAARAGVLNTRSHTSNWLGGLQEKAPEYTGSSLYQDIPRAVSDQGVVTASGNSPMTFAAEIIKLVEKTNGSKIAKEFLQTSAQEFG